MDEYSFEFCDIQSHSEHTAQTPLRHSIYFFVARIFGIGIIDHILSDMDGRVE